MKQFIIFILIFFTISCCEPKDQVTYIQKWNIEVFYLNGETEKISCEFKYETRTPEIKLISDDSTPCIVMRNSYNYEIVTCGVRKFNIISTEKTSFKKPQKK